MDSYTLLYAGLAVTLFTAYDLIYTTFAPRGAGPISSFVTTLVWHKLKLLYKITGRRLILRGTGPIIVCSTLLLWVLLLWGGHFMILLADKNAVVDSTTNVEANKLQRVYYTGYMLSTMGNGDFKGGTDGWRVYAAVISFTGLTLITIAISYMVPVISAVTERRALCIRVRALGETAEDIILNHWNGQDCKRIQDKLDALTENISLQGQMHLSYPVLQYFHHGDKATALVPTLAVLDEALSIMLVYLPEQSRPEPQYLEPLRKSITVFLQTLTIVSDFEQKTKAPPLEVGRLRAKGIPLQSPEHGLIEHLDHRRKLLKSMIEHDCWDWYEEADSPFKAKMDLPHLS